MSNYPYRNKDYLNKRGYLHILHDSKCQLCNYKSISNEVHHKDHDNCNNELDNLILLCKQCHEIIHKGKHII